MSLGIDVDRVVRVLLTDGWHDVEGNSFFVDSYEYLWSGMDGVSVRQFRTAHPGEQPLLVHGGGQGGVCATGFRFTETGTFADLCGPLTAILAIEVASQARRRSTLVERELKRLSEGR